MEKVEIWTGVTDASLTDRQTTEDSATQLVYSIKFKLSHAMSTNQPELLFHKILHREPLVAFWIFSFWHDKSRNSCANVI